MKLTDSLKFLAKKLPCELKDGTYYDYVQNSFRELINILSQVPEEEIIDIMKDFHQVSLISEPHTKRRFINLIQKIEDECIDILDYAYKGDIISASTLLWKLLTVPSYTQYKFIESFGNNLARNGKLKSCVFYRCRDAPFKPVKPDDFWHIPFESRKVSSPGRFNLMGIPCFYLSNSVECANAEMGVLDNSKTNQRWCQKFTNKNTLIYLDLSMPSDIEIESMDDVEKLSFIITYPFSILSLCSIEPDNKKIKFREEYLFPQLFFHVFFRYLNPDTKIPNFNGIYYSSTKYKGGKNLIVPATYSTKTPQMSGYSKEILDMFSIEGDPFKIDTSVNMNKG